MKRFDSETLLFLVRRDSENALRPHWAEWRNLIEIDEQTLITKELQQLKLPKASAVYGQVKQDFEYQGFQEKELSYLPTTQKLIDDYLVVYRKIESEAGFCPSTPSIGINHYLPGGLIEAHFDESKYRNIISIFNICGEAIISIHSDRQTKTHNYPTTPGSLMLLSAPKNLSEKKIRPLHSISVVAERYAVVIRHEAING